MITQTIYIFRGWSWISVNVIQTDMSPQGILGSFGPQDNDLVKSQYVFTQYYSGYGFYGTLDVLTNVDMYKVFYGNEAEVLLYGFPVSIPISFSVLLPCWTWLSCPYQALL